MTTTNSAANSAANSAFRIKKWEEVPYLEGEDGRKLTRCSVEYLYEGDLSGESVLEYLMSYNPDGTGTFVGIERVEGSLKGKQGSFVFQHVGTFDATSVSGRLTIAPGSADGDLTGLSGNADLRIAGHADAYPLLLVVEGV